MNHLHEHLAQAEVRARVDQARARRLGDELARAHRAGRRAARAARTATARAL